MTPTQSATCRAAGTILAELARQHPSDRGLAPDDAMRRIRDAFGVHDGTIRDEASDEGGTP